MKLIPKSYKSSLEKENVGNEGLGWEQVNGEIRGHL